MHMPPFLTKFQLDARAAAQRQSPSTGKDDEELAIGWECAIPSLQIDTWKEETAAQSQEAAH